MWLQAGDAAERLGLTSQAVRDLARAGRLPFERTPRGAFLFRSADVEALRQRRSQRLGSGPGGPEYLQDRRRVRPGTSLVTVAQEEFRGDQPEEASPSSQGVQRICDRTDRDQETIADAMAAINALAGDFEP